MRHLRTTILLALASLLAPWAHASAPGYWAPHIEARTAMVALHAATLGTGKVLLLGDSNTEAFWWARVGECYAINAGMGGARIADAAQQARYIAATTRPRIVHVMLGTNDLAGAAGAGEGWAATAQGHMGTIVAEFQAVGSVVVVWPVPPFGPAYSGARLQDLAALNTALFTAAATRGAHWDWWWPAQFTGADGYANPGAMLPDGVHFTPELQASRYYRLQAWHQYLAGAGVACQ